MIGHFRRTPQAREDLIAIWSYIAADNPAAAAKLLLKLDRAMAKLAANPGIGRERPELLPGIRSYASKPYVIFYKIADPGIEIYRVLHGARDIENIFGVMK